MGFEYLTNVPLAQARKEYLERLVSGGFGSKAETIPVFESCGRVTAKAVYAHICAPHYAASAMDGVAVSAKETFGATETTPVTLNPDQFLVLDTGDPIPEDKDAVIMVEDIVKNGDGSITIHAAAAPWQHIRQIGEDVCAGEMILPSHMTVSPAAIGAMIAGGVLEICGGHHPHRGRDYPALYRPEARGYSGIQWLHFFRNGAFLGRRGGGLSHCTG